MIVIEANKGKIASQQGANIDLLETKQEHCADRVEQKDRQKQSCRQQEEVRANPFANPALLVLCTAYRSFRYLW